METRIAVISMILENASCAGWVNAILNMASASLDGWAFRTGKRAYTSSAWRWTRRQNHQRPFPGKLGRIQGVSLKTAYSAAQGGEPCAKS